ncbi:hypothetical protein BH10ACT2_BH10ACT2_03740 [soil metagenome]
MSEGDDGSTAGNAFDVVTEGVATGSDLRQTLTARTPVAEQIPVRISRQNLATRQPFVRAVVVFLEQRNWFGNKLRES